MNRKLLLFIFLLILLPGCQTAEVLEETPPPPATATATIPAAAPETVLTPTPPPTAPPTAEPTPEPDTPTPAPTPTSTPAATDTSYNVIFVADDDTLNVRAEAGADHAIVARLAPDAASIRVTGAGQRVSDWLWLPIETNDVTGWVNSFYLTETVSDELFCTDAAVLTLLTDLRAAVADKDGEALAEMVHPEHGLTIHRYWWNPAVRIEATDVAGLFTSNESYYWGTEDGSGFDMNGTFMNYIYPRLERNLLPARVLGCNEIMHGATAGHVWLPEGYENVNFYSFYRPHAEDEFELDWGSWVVGIERWQGRYYISYLVHFEWEI